MAALTPCWCSPVSFRRTSDPQKALLNRTITGINQKADYEVENPVAVPTYVVTSLGDFAVLANKA
jgi:hypothetical protein